MKTGLKNASESSGAMPAQGVKLQIKSIERSKVAADAQFGTPGALQYIATFTVVEPKRFKGEELRSYFEIGTADDPGAKRKETWESGRGVSNLKRLLIRSGTPIEEDEDEVWMEAAAGNTVCVHTQLNAKGFPAINMRDGFFREEDEDFVGIGTKITAASAPGKGTPAPKKRIDDDEDDAPAPAKKAAVAEDEDEPAPKKAPKKRAVADDDDNED